MRTSDAERMNMAAMKSLRGSRFIIINPPQSNETVRRRLGRLLGKPFEHAGGHSRSPRVTTVTEHRLPGNRAIVALSTELAIDDFFHIDIVCTGLHLENCRMADLALKFGSVIPMGKDDGGHAPLLSLAVQDHVAIITGNFIPGQKGERQ